MSDPSLNRILFRKRVLRLAQCGLAMIVLPGANSLRGADGISDSRILPEPVTEEHFAALKAHSPFLRSVGLSDSVVLTGVARIENDVFATLFDTETRESHVVSRRENPQGWQLVDVRGDEADLESLTAKIQVAGGEVISIRYEKLPSKSDHGNSGSRSGVGGSSRLSSSQLQQAKYAAVNYRGEHPADGFPRKPPPEVVEKLSKMSVQQRESINREMIELRNRGLGMEERRKIYGEKVDRTAQGRR
jgi:hypothetical protein